MKPIGYARSREYWIRFGWGTLTGLIGAAIAFVYIIIVHGLEHLLWDEEIPVAPFSGSVKIVVITTLAGLLVGIIHKIIPTKEVDVFGAIAQGDMDLTHVLGAVMASVVSLIGGFALGPEAPTGMLAGGVSVWISKKRHLPKAILRTNLLSSVAGAFAGLFTAPFATILVAFELKHRQSPYYYGTLAIVAVASILGFTVFYAAGGNRFSAVLRLLELPPYELDIWHVFAGVLLGLIGVVFAFGFAVLMKAWQQLMIPFHNRPMLRCTSIGLLIGLLGMAMPITLFLGTEGLLTVVEGRQNLPLGFLLCSALLKIVAVTIVLAGGFIGGPIFPLLFVGGTLGVVIWQLLPGLPVMMTVGGMMAAVPCALVPFPVTLAVIVLIITGTPAVDAIPVLTAALTAHFIFQGVVLSNPIAVGQQRQDIDAALQEAAADRPPEAIM